MGGVISSRSSEPASRPTAQRSPHQSPSPRHGGWWGDCGGPQGERAARALGRRSAAKTTDMTPAAAALRPTCHQAQRLARRSSRSGQTQRGPASGVAGGRGDELASARRAKPEHDGQFGKWARRARAAWTTSRARGPGHGKGRLVLQFKLFGVSKDAGRRARIARTSVRRSGSSHLLRRSALRRIAGRHRRSPLSCQQEVDQPHQLVGCCRWPWARPCAHTACTGRRPAPTDSCAALVPPCARPARRG
jgi:hypothetical protein